MVLARDVWVFTGLLARTHVSRDQGFLDLLDMMKNPDSSIPLHALKIEVSVSTVSLLSLFHYLAPFSTPSNLSVFCHGFFHFGRVVIQCAQKKDVVI